MYKRQALGGEVTQDIHTQIKHDQDADKNEPTHSISIEKNSTLYHIYPSEKLFVNSFHHQAVSNTGDRFVATATAPDGIIEAMESTDCLLYTSGYKSCTALQSIKNKVRV